MTMTESEVPVRTGTRKILVVDDDRSAARALGRILTDAGYEPTVCHGGIEALASARAEPPDAA